MLRTSTVDSYAVTDFERYTPSADAPSSFGLSPVGEDGRVTGVFVVQLPLDGIDRVMTTDGEWEAAGMGETGEAYLVGPDGTLRSTSRLLVEDPEGYEADVVEEGVTPALAAHHAESGNPVMRQRVDAGSVQQAHKRQSGITTETDFHGHRVLTAYAPADIDGLNWAVIAQIDEDEALAPVTDFLRTLALSVLALVLLVTLASLVLAKAFSRPVMELLAGVRRVASGDLQARVDIRNRDEFADLAVAFNEMAASLSTKQDLLDAQLRENDRLLLTLMPRPVADRFRGGEQNIADEHHDVSVIFATVEGFDDFTAGKAPDEAIRLLNELYSRFESTAERSAVERVRTLRSGFIACSGLHVPRVDHATRIVDFAREMAETVARYNAQFDAALELRAGIDSGTVTTGLVGGSSLYDLWGDSVNLAFGVQSSAPEPGIYVTQAVHDLISDSQPLVAAGTLAVQGDERPVWRLDGDRGRHG